MNAEFLFGGMCATSTRVHQFGCVYMYAQVHALTFYIEIFTVIIFCRSSPKTGKPILLTREKSEIKSPVKI